MNLEDLAKAGALYIGLKKNSEVYILPDGNIAYGNLRTGYHLLPPRPSWFYQERTEARQ